jgi:hypothetical protein
MVGREPQGNETAQELHTLERGWVACCWKRIVMSRETTHLGEQALELDNVPYWQQQLPKAAL